MNVRFSAPVESTFSFDDALIHVDAKGHTRERTNNKQVAEATPTAERLLYLSIQGGKRSSMLIQRDWACQLDGWHESRTE